jgi:hypothetical protein
MDLEQRLERVEGELAQRRELERFARENEIRAAAFRSGREAGRSWLRYFLLGCWLGLLITLALRSGGDAPE